MYYSMVKSHSANFCTNTVITLITWLPQKFAVITLKFEQWSLMWLYHRVMCPKEADRMANSADPEHWWSSLIWVYNVSQDLSVWKLRIITVLTYYSKHIFSNSNPLFSFLLQQLIELAVNSAAGYVNFPFLFQQCLLFLFRSWLRRRNKLWSWNKTALWSGRCVTRYHHKNPKNSDTRKVCCNRSKIWTRWPYIRIMHPKVAEGMANSADPDQTAPLWSGSTLFAQDLSVRKFRNIMVSLKPACSAIESS